MARRKRGRGRPSFENYYKVRRKAYRKYLKEYKKAYELYGSNMTLAMDYKDFVSYAKIARQDARNINRRFSVKTFVKDQIMSTLSQSQTATRNFNNHLDEMRAKYKFHGVDKLSDYEREMLEQFGFESSGEYLRVKDVRGREWKYQAAYNIADRYGMGKEAFGS